jgi:hypothetical protein
MLYPRRLAHTLKDVRESKWLGGGCAGPKGDWSSEGGPVSLSSLNTERH